MSGDDQQQWNSPQAAVFQERAAHYADFYSDKKSSITYNFHRRLEIASDFASGFSGALLDCASGTGEVTESILSSGRFREATVVDLSTNMLQQARQRLERHEGKIRFDFVNQDIFSFRPTNVSGSYNLILCLGLIAHTGRLEELLRHLGAMLAPGGGILLQSSLSGHVGNRLKTMWTGRRSEQQEGYKISYFRLDDIEKGVEAAGLTIRRQQRYRLGIPFANRIWPAGVYGAERLLDVVARRIGGEAVFLLQRPS
ncbi:ubiquinone/menaquinone biosynthesis methyltransferase [Caulifigura coniformis]|uniref:Ubiquinone/menaquinone biosynthesis methyltransferase n=1 Tax=Caulifigura coniformis TaxID=2527983 RepID=A0A517SGJ6_9PLAN|nr:class I SAM-dependent methyltransferase [Caulifigura coniformis]QDT55248.1 ubiquinone/menaquinone biosynthesis methyltransferase [Caulifigura coniformis]